MRDGYKEIVIHLHNGVLVSGNTNNIIKFVGKWIQLEKIILSKVTLTKNDKNLMYLLVSEY